MIQYDSEAHLDRGAHEDSGTLEQSGGLNLVTAAASSIHQLMLKNLWPTELRKLTMPPELFATFNTISKSCEGSIQKCQENYLLISLSRIVPWLLFGLLFPGER